LKYEYLYHNLGASNQYKYNPFDEDIVLRAVKRGFNFIRNVVAGVRDVARSVLIDIDSALYYY
jgi:hypothetical protein